MGWVGRNPGRENKVRKLLTKETRGVQGTVYRLFLMRAQALTEAWLAGTRPEAQAGQVVAGRECHTYKCLRVMRLRLCSPDNGTFWKVFM